MTSVVFAASHAIVKYVCRNPRVLLPVANVRVSPLFFFLLPTQALARLQIIQHDRYANKMKRCDGHSHPRKINHTGQSRYPHTRKAKSYLILSHPPLSLPPRFKILYSLSHPPYLMDILRTICQTTSQTDTCASHPLAMIGSLIATSGAKSSKRFPPASRRCAG